MIAGHGFWACSFCIPVIWIYWWVSLWLDREVIVVDMCWLHKRWDTWVRHAVVWIMVLWFGVVWYGICWVGKCWCLAVLIPLTILVWLLFEKKAPFKFLAKSLTPFLFRCFLSIRMLMHWKRLICLTSKTFDSLDIVLSSCRFNIWTCDRRWSLRGKRLDIIIRHLGYSLRMVFISPTILSLTALFGICSMSFAPQWMIIIFG
jgi:hypothetical protein